jgi:hypothetical protein
MRSQAKKELTRRMILKRRLRNCCEAAAREIIRRAEFGDPREAGPAPGAACGCRGDAFDSAAGGRRRGSAEAEQLHGLSQEEAAPETTGGDPATGGSGCPRDVRLSYRSACAQLFELGRGGEEACDLRGAPVGPGSAERPRDEKARGRHASVAESRAADIHGVEPRTLHGTSERRGAGGGGDG